MTQYLSLQFINKTTGRLNTRGTLDNVNLGLPAIEGLDLVCTYVDESMPKPTPKVLAICPDDSELPRIEDGSITKAVTVLDQGRFISLAKTIFASLQKEMKDEANTECRERIDALTAKYSSTEITYSLSRMDEYHAAIAAATEEAAIIAAPSLVTEATTAQMTVKDLAASILAKIETYNNDEGLLKGTRKLITNQIEAVVFNPDDIKTSFKQLHAIDRGLFEDL